MSKQKCLLFYLIVTFIVMVVPVGGALDSIEVIALQQLYKALMQPPQLTNWGSDTDPCNEWLGVGCDITRSSVIYIYIHGLNLAGSIPIEICNLYHLERLNMNSNYIYGEFPSCLPVSVTYINMAYTSISYDTTSLSRMERLQYLNLSHNSLSGPLGEVFTGLQNLTIMDLSYNNFTGDLPSSFGSLIHLSKLYLQKNEFTGSVACLSELPLIDLNVQDNNFSGIIPSHLLSIPNLRTEGNRFLLPPPPATRQWHLKGINEN